MPLLRLSRSLSRFKRFTAADLFDAPTDRVIAQGRLVLCILSLIAIHIDPTQPARYAATAYQLMIAYTAFSVVMVALTAFTFLRPASRLAAQVVDIAVISTLLFLTEGPTSPFFVFFTFILLATALRWRSRGLIATAAVLAVVLLVASIVEARLPSSLEPVDYDLSRALIRGAYLLVIGGMLAYVTVHRDRCRDRLARLAHWPAHEVAHVHCPSLEQTLAHAAGVLSAPRILVVWEEAEEPFVLTASWCSGVYQQRREAAGRFGHLVHQRLANDAFVTRRTRPDLCLLRHGPERIDGYPIDPDLVAEFSIGSAVTAPFTGTICSGRVFILDRSTWTDDDLVLTEIIASRTGVELDRQILQRQSEETIATRERMRLTRDLHDSILQSLTAAALQLRLAADEEGENLRSRLDIVKQLLTQQQSRIRGFVQGMSAATGEKGSMLACDLQKPLSETALHWGCAATLSVEPQEATVPRAMGGELSLMLAEAVANAVRHGRASKIDVALAKRNGQIVVTVRDNGTGFSTNGTRTPSASTPVSLRGRLHELGGTLEVSSSSAGAELELRVPVP